MLSAPLDARHRAFNARGAMTFARSHLMNRKSVEPTPHADVKTAATVLHVLKEVPLFVTQ
jgi:hypothetical protein